MVVTHGQENGLQIIPALKQNEAPPALRLTTDRNPTIHHSPDPLASDT